MIYLINVFIQISLFRLSGWIGSCYVLFVQELYLIEITNKAVLRSKNALMTSQSRCR